MNLCDFEKISYLMHIKIQATTINIKWINKYNYT